MSSELTIVASSKEVKIPNNSKVEFVVIKYLFFTKL